MEEDVIDVLEIFTGEHNCTFFPKIHEEIALNTCHIPKSTCRDPKCPEFDNFPLFIIPFWLPIHMFLSNQIKIQYPR